MLTPGIDAFRAELSALDDLLDRVPRATIRDDRTRDRFRLLFRVWRSSIAPGLGRHLQKRRDFYKLSAELEAMAQLASKHGRVAEYRKRVRRSRDLLDALVIYLPPSRDATKLVAPPRDDLFVPEIPDVPLALVPNALLGWRTEIREFLDKHPYDRSVFIMIRYRNKNVPLLNEIKATLAKHKLFGVVASDHNLTDDLYNPIACLLCCSKGIAVFDSPEAEQQFNPNVAYELGMFHLLGRACIILKHHALKALQSDILMKLYRPYRTRATAHEVVNEWAAALGPV